MRTCIYYDLDEIHADAIRYARKREPDAIEVAASGSGWPESGYGPTPAEVPDRRAPAYQDDMMVWFDKLLNGLRTAGAESFSEHRGVDLLETVRYDFLNRIAPTEHCWRAICEIHTRYRPQRLMWITTAERRRQLAGISDCGLPIEIQLVAFHSAANWLSRSMRTIPRYVYRLAIRALTSSSRFLRRAALKRDVVDARVVFVEFFPNSAHVLVPVARALRERYSIEACWLAARPSVRDSLRRQGIACTLLDDVVADSRQNLENFATDDRQHLRRTLDRLPDELFTGTTAIAGRPLLQKAIERHLVACLNDATHWVDAFTLVWKRFKPKCVVSTTFSSNVGRAARQTARQTGAHGIYVQHGLLLDNFYVFSHVCSDWLLLWGDYDKRCVSRWSSEMQIVRVTGATIYDDLALNHTPSAVGVVTSVDCGLNVAFMASRSGGAVLSLAMARLTLLTIAEAVRRTPNARLTVKLHPGDRTGLIPRTLAAYPEVKLATNATAEDVIATSDVVVVVSSTTGLEACAAGKPLVVLNPTSAGSLVPYSEYGAAVELCISDVGATQRLANHLQNLPRSPCLLQSLAAGRRRLLDDMLNGGRGDAAELASDAIVEALSTHVMKPTTI